MTEPDRIRTARAGHAVCPARGVGRGARRDRPAGRRRARAGRGGLRRRSSCRPRDHGDGVGGDRCRAARAPARRRRSPWQTRSRVRQITLAHSSFGVRRGGDRGAGRGVRRRGADAAARRRRRWPSKSWRPRTCGRFPRPLANGTATVMFSHDRNAGVLVMNNVPPPAAGHRLSDVVDRGQRPDVGGHHGHRGGDTLDDGDAHQPRVSSTALAFTVEPGNGSPQPTSTILAELPLS